MRVKEEHAPQQIQFHTENNEFLTEGTLVQVIYKNHLQQYPSKQQVEVDMVSTCLRIEFATPRVHMRVGADLSTAVQR